MRRKVIGMGDLKKNEKIKEDDKVNQSKSVHIRFNMKWVPQMH